MDIGDTDYELRDGLIFSIFVRWIEEKQYFSHEELIDLLNTILSEDFAFYKIGSENDDSVLQMYAARASGDDYHRVAQLTVVREHSQIMIAPLSITVTPLLLLNEQMHLIC